MADAAAPEKKPIDELIEKFEKKHKSYQNWIKTLETNHSMIYTNAIAKVLKKDGKDGKGAFDYSALDTDPKLRADLAKEIINQYMDFGKKTYGLDFSDDMMKAQGMYFLTKRTERQIMDEINNRKGNYTLGQHQKVMESHIEDMKDVMQTKVTDHIEEGHAKDVLKYMGLDGVVDENLVKSNIHELRSVFYNKYIMKNEADKPFIEKYKKKEEKKAA